jgi:hypothetical protein
MLTRFFAPSDPRWTVEIEPPSPHPSIHPSIQPLPLPSVILSHGGRHERREPAMPDPTLTPPPRPTSADKGWVRYIFPLKIIYSHTYYNSIDKLDVAYSATFLTQLNNNSSRGDGGSYMAIGRWTRLWRSPHQSPSKCMFFTSPLHDYKIKNISTFFKNVTTFFFFNISSHFRQHFTKCWNMFWDQHFF